MAKCRRRFLRGPRETAFAHSRCRVLIFSQYAHLYVLQGNYLSSESDPFPTTARTLLYFPSGDLPTLPAERFRDLFLTRQKWRADVLIPFIDEITVDNKVRDKLLLKFCRPMTDNAGRVWYTGRGNY